MIWIYLVLLFLLGVIGYIANETLLAVKRLASEVEALKRMADK